MLEASFGRVAGDRDIPGSFAGTLRPVVPVFLYGTLMRGERAHALLRGAAFVATVRTAPCFDLVDLGGYPGLVSGGRTSVAGEIFQAPSPLFDVLDAYEEVGELYRRTALVVAGRRVWAYVIDPDRARGLPRIRSGDWRNRVA